VVVEADDLLAAVVDVVDEDRELDSRGTLAVIVTPRLVDLQYAALVARFGASVGRGAQGLSRPIAVITPQESKGLEFDTVVVVEPNEIIEASTRGVGALYVAMTRPTQRLHLVGTSAIR
jgi:superfamily I DNA/RNA helicase